MSISISNQEIVTLDVGGEFFKTYRSTLEKSPYFYAMFNTWNQVKKPDQPIFIDRNPRRFRHILNLLRNSKYPFPKDSYPELNFFCLDAENLVE